MLFFSAINKSRSQAVPLATIGYHWLPLAHWLIGSIGSPLAPSSGCPIGPLAAIG
jgi:hypothetical protein